MTISQKILAAHAGKESVKPGEYIEAKVDMLMFPDSASWQAINTFSEWGGEKVFNPEKIAMIPDHMIPARDVIYANRHQDLRRFAKAQGIRNFFEVGRSGICHAMMVQEGLALPGDLVIGTDSHTVTYGGVGAFSTGVGSTDGAGVLALGTIWMKVPESIKVVYRGKRGKWLSGKDLMLYTLGKIGVDGARYQSIEFTGEAVADLPMHDRLTMCNMAIEGGGKNGIFAPDDVTRAYVESRAQRLFTCYESDADASYSAVYEWDISDVKPQVAFPHLPSNVRPVDEAGDVPINQAFLGSCTNGWIEDLRIAASILKGKKVHPDVRLVVIPATQKIYRQALEEGVLGILAEAGGAICTPNCGPCTAGQMGVIGDGERCISTTNRNFVGRMGSLTSETYLASPAVVAASAIKGRIAHPEEVTA